MVVLAADVGGTNTRVALFEGTNCLYKKTYSSREHANLSLIILDFLQLAKRSVTKACFGVAGPVKDGKCHATNLPWTIDASVIQQEAAIESIWLINDLEANAYGLRRLSPNEWFTLNKGMPMKGNQALISAGTGLGEAGLFWNGHEHIPFACEGGHADFAPISEIDLELWQYLRGKYEHISYERVLSGPGLYNLYQFLIESGREKETQPIVSKDPPRIISERALKKECPAAVRALDWFVILYGSEAGNLALKMLALGGIFIGGGIAPHILPVMQSPLFMEAFVAKGRFRELLKSIPVKVVLNDQTALLGAAYYAQEIGGRR